ncbi:MAG: hypothetical protein ACJ75B_19010 [Flavisolibacter sp.]
MNGSIYVLSTAGSVLKKITFGEFKGNISPSLKIVNSQIFLFYYESGDEKGSCDLKCSTLDTATLELSPAKTVFQHLPAKYLIPEFSFNAPERKLFIKGSPDQSKIGVIWNSGKDRELFFGVFDNQLNPAWFKHEVLGSAGTIDLREPYITDQSVLLDDRSAVYLGCVLIVKKDVQRHLVVLREKEPALDHEIGSSDHRPFDIRIAASSKDLIQIVGTSTNSKERIVGAYFTGMSTADFNLQTWNETLLPDSLVKQFAVSSCGSVKPKNYGLDRFYTTLYRLDDGSLDLVGECRIYHEPEDRISSYYGMADMLNIRFPKNHEPIFNRLYKEAQPSSSGSAFFFAYPSEHDMMILYEDLESNLKTKMSDLASSYSIFNYRFVLACAMIGPDGAIQRKKIADGHNLAGAYFFFSQSVFIPHSLVMIPMVKKQKDLYHMIKWAVIK